MEKRKLYEAPWVEILEIVVEKGYEVSYEAESYSITTGTWD